MGQVCFASEENEKKIQELEELLKDQETEKKKLKRELESEQERQKQYKKTKRDREDDINTDKIQQLTTEKQQVFKSMLKERKNVSKLEDQIQDYKTQISVMDDKIHRLKDEKRKAQKRAEEAEKRQKEKNKKNKGKPRSSSNADSESKGFGAKTLDGIETKDYMKELGLPALDTSNKGGGKSEPPKGSKDSLLKPRYGVKKGYHSDGGVTSDSERGGATTTDNESSDDEDAMLESKTTEILDENYDPQTEATHVYSWLHGQS